MNVELEMGNWIVNDEYFITEEIGGYAVYNCGTDTEDAKELFKSESFEECLTWVWNSV